MAEPLLTQFSRAGVLVLGTRTRSTRVLNFLYSYCTRTHELQSNSTRTCTRGQVLVRVLARVLIFYGTSHDL